MTGTSRPCQRYSRGPAKLKDDSRTHITAAVQSERERAVELRRAGFRMRSASEIGSGSQKPEKNLEWNWKWMIYIVNHTALKIFSQIPTKALKQ
jgi:hypothetical protein